ncbi:hypothetical protein G3I60_04965 [Streptomyces sp. SID13666]|uniref:hypothetical protein n=1 Tax=Streptomyces sp. SID13666 TaxID=2706054 RepID=UPI0013C148BB|nr:hypothetical protein [Streptomyces sp. SID13666]NEA53520.1 hypothetical protein [Streptomyces sp. SID13666]
MTTMTCAVRALARPLDVAHTAYVVGAAPAAPPQTVLSGPLFRAFLRSNLMHGGAAALDEGTGEVTFTVGRRVFAAEPTGHPGCAPCVRCAHWAREHDLPWAVSACRRFQMRIGHRQQHEGAAVGFDRQMGSTWYRFEISPPTDDAPGGRLRVHRYPRHGEEQRNVHVFDIPVERRNAVVALADPQRAARALGNARFDRLHRRR